MFNQQEQNRINARFRMIITEPTPGIDVGKFTTLASGVTDTDGTDANLILTSSEDFEESTDEGMHTYDETTDIAVFGVLANYLIGYKPKTSGSFFIAGIGLASVGIEWEERSATDVSLGPLLPGGGSMQSVDGSGGGTVFNLGYGRTFPSGLDLRFELPVIVSFAVPGEASAVIPTFIVTAGLRF